MSTAPGSGSRESRPGIALAAGAFAAVTIVFAIPLSLDPASRALDLGPDTRLFLWTISWDVQALGRDPLHVFDANIFFPEPRTLAFSEHQIGSAILAAPVLLVTGEPLLAMNAVLLFSCFASGLGTFILARQLGFSSPASLLAGLVFMLAPPRFFRLGQLHLATVQWMPFCLALVHRYAGGGRARHLLGAALLFSLQAWSGAQSGLFLAVSIALLFVYLLALGEIRQPRNAATARAIGLSGLLVLGLNLPFALPYLEVRRDLGLERSLSEAEAWSPNAASFAASPAHAHQALRRAVGWERGVRREANTFLFPGVVPLVLAAAALLATRRSRSESPSGGSRPQKASAPVIVLDGLVVGLALLALLLEAAGGVRLSLGGLRVSASGGERAALAALALLGLRIALVRNRSWAFLPLARRGRFLLRSFVARRVGLHAGFYVFLAAFSLWAALGPSFGLYAALHRLVPGFDFVRVPSRLTLLTVLSLSILAGAGLDALRERFRPRLRGIVSTFFVAVLLGELAAFPLDATPYSVRISGMDRFLADRKRDGAEAVPIAVLPVPDPRDGAAAASRHSAYMLHSTAHFLPLVNGYSGFTPPRHDALFRTLAGFPSETSLQALEARGVKLVVIHRDGYGDGEWETLVEGLAALGERLRLVASFDDGRIYELTRPPAPTPRDRGA